MQKTMNIILKAAAALLAVTLAASCVFEKEEPSQTQQKYKYVLVQLGVNTDKMVATKADGDVTESDPETAINNLRVYAYTKGDNGNKVLCGYLYAEDVDTASENTAPLLMDIKVPFNEYEKEQTVYFAAVANTGAMDATEGIIINELGRNPDGSLDLPSNFSWDGFSDIIYQINQAKFATTGMPMYFQTDVTKAPVDQSADDYDPENKEDDDAPVKINLKATGTSVNQPGHNGHTKLPIKVTLGMTRSLAKITVHAAEDAATTGTSNAGIQITGVELMNVIADGPLFPAAASTTAISPAPAMTVSTDAITAGVADADKTNASMYTQATSAYYLAENAAGVTGKFYGEYTTDEDLATEAAGATALKISYKVGNSEKTGYVIMPQIERNTWYKVLARIKANGEVTLTLKVEEWASGEIAEVDFQNEVTLSEPSWKYGDGVSNENGNIIFDTAGDLESTYYFTLETPVGGRWYASLDGDIQNFVLETAGVNEDEVVTGKTVSGPITAQQSYVKIKTIASNAGMGQKTAILRIVAKTATGDRTLTVKFDESGKEYYTLVQKQ